MAKHTADFATYVEARWQRLVHTATLMGLSGPDVEDAVQSSLIRAYTKWPKVLAASDTDAYVTKILINTIRAGRRRKWSGELPQDPSGFMAGANLDDDSDRIVGADTLLRALHRLPPEQRAVLILRFYNDFSETQTAEILRIRPGTVKSRASRGLNALREDRDLISWSAID